MGQEAIELYVDIKLIMPSSCYSSNIFKAKKYFSSY